MRVILDTAETAELEAGITPAHAGNTAGSLLVGRSLGDHPRACG